MRLHALLLVLACSAVTIQFGCADGNTSSAAPTTPADDDSDDDSNDDESDDDSDPKTKDAGKDAKDISPDGGTKKDGSASDSGADAQPPVTPGVTTGITYTIDGKTVTDTGAYGRRDSTQSGNQTTYNGRVIGYGGPGTLAAGTFSMVILNSGFPVPVGDYPCSKADHIPSMTSDVTLGSWSTESDNSCIVHVTSSSPTHFAGTISGTLIKLGGKTAQASASFDYPIP